MSNLYCVESEVRGDIKGGYRLKIAILDLGVYIDGFTARRSGVDSSGWWIQPPAKQVGGKWKHVIEFDKSKTLWTEIVNCCLDTINLYQQNESKLLGQVEDVSDAAIERGLDEAIQMFGIEKTKTYQKPKNPFEGLS